MIEIKEISFGDKYYELSKVLRNEILRKPIGLVLNEDDTKNEDHQFHIALIENNEDVMGTIIINPISGEIAEFRGVALSENYQGQGLGRKLVEFAEEFVKNKEFTKIEMKARIVAQKFYEVLGYQVVGEVFIKSTIPHIKMIKEDIKNN